VNVQEYIESGIIESYVMDLATESERAEFEQYCTQYPELVAARKDFEEKLERHASENAEHPPVGVKVKILEAIGNQGSLKSVSFNPPKQIINMENSTSSRGSGWSRLAAAASIILIVGLAWFGYRTSSANKDLADKNSALTEKLNSTDSILNQIVAEQKVVKDPNVTVVNMVGTQVAPKSSANIYWDSTSSNVYLVVKNMPNLPSDKQYQLWALIDGKPKDLGVFDASEDKVILQMKNTQKAQAFAITIQQRGGSPSPTLEKMQSLGKVQQNQ
jgi:anti-sigma-K factor RskA